MGKWLPLFFSITSFCSLSIYGYDYWGVWEHDEEYYPQNKATEPLNETYAENNRDYSAANHGGFLRRDWRERLPEAMESLEKNTKLYQAYLKIFNSK